MKREVALFDHHANQTVPATLIERIDLGYAENVDSKWLTFLAAENAQAQSRGNEIKVPEHSHWIWAKKVAIVQRLLPYQTLSIEHEEMAQGLMLLKTDGGFARLPADSGKPLVYVEFLATAPWNLRPVVAKPRFSGVGTMLLRAAVEISVDLEFKGRIGLHSLPQSDGFYKRSGMTALGFDETKKLNYYEMSPDQAAAFLS